MLRRNVEVKYAASMGVGQRVGEADRDVRCQVRRQWAFVDQQLVERAPLRQLGGNVGKVALKPAVVHRGNGWMTQALGRLDSGDQVIARIFIIALGAIDLARV